MTVATHWETFWDVQCPQCSGVTRREEDAAEDHGTMNCTCGYVGAPLATVLWNYRKDWGYEQVPIVVNRHELAMLWSLVGKRRVDVSQKLDASPVRESLEEYLAVLGALQDRFGKALGSDARENQRWMFNVIAPVNFANEEPMSIDPDDLPL